MSQRTALRELDADLAAAFLDGGMADTATYLRKGAAAASAVPCTVLIDRDVQYVGDGYSQSPTKSTVITVFLADIGAPPVKGDVVTLLEDDTPTETFCIDRPISVDESRAVCLVLIDD